MSVSTVAMICITLIYPLALWLGQGQIEPRFLAGLLVVIGVIRLQTLKASPIGLWWIGGTLFLFIAAVWSNLLLPLKLYPVLVNAALLGIFLHSLIFPPSIIERFARIREPNLPAWAIGYTRRVTQVWCIFFTANGLIALITALWTTSGTWAVYNGLIAYLAIGLLFTGEYLVRWHFKRQLNA
ncbi:MAG TPA: hypothetical protein VIE89_09235 [Candidatus Binatia bacterium]|jgi:uncharacterized membrane protein